MLALFQPLPLLSKFLARRSVPPCDDKQGWLRDPLSYPAIAAMSADQLADLPAAELRARLRC